MSSRCKTQPEGFRSDIQTLLLAAEAGQKADILTYSSGHLGPRSLNQSQAHRETKPSFWRTSRSSEENLNPVTSQQAQVKTLTHVKKKEREECPSESSSGTALVESDESRSRRDHTTGCSSHADKREDTTFSQKESDCVSDPVGEQPSDQTVMNNEGPTKMKQQFGRQDLWAGGNVAEMRERKLQKPRTFSQKKSNCLSDPEGKQHSDQTVLNNEGQLKMKQRFGRQVTAKQDLLWAGRNVAEIHERKLQKELRRMSAQSWPSRDRLAVFSDVFDDVCEGSPVFGRILREIKTDYDLYVNHLMGQSSLHSMSLDISLQALGDDKVWHIELDDAEKEVCKLEEEARRALEENKRVRNESQNVPAMTGPEDIDIKTTSLSGLQYSGTATGRASGVESKRLQVLNVWQEIQQLEEELKEKPVPSVSTTDTERHRDLKLERIRLIASNDRLKITNKELENNINMMLNREKASKATRRMLWEEIQCDLQSESE